jgi:hypothetical protein
LPADHPLANEVALGHVLLAASSYNEQCESLQSEVGESVFVAQYQATRSEETGRIRSYSVWSQGVPSLLPVTGEIVMVEDPESDAPPIFRVPWATALELAGSFLGSEPVHDPPRHLADPWPDPPTLARLKAAAIPDGQ